MFQAIEYLKIYHDTEYISIQNNRKLSFRLFICFEFLIYVDSNTPFEHCTPTTAYPEFITAVVYCCTRGN